MKNHDFLKLSPAVSSMLTAAKISAPDSKTAEAFEHLVGEMVDNREGSEAIVKAVAGTLHDGLAFGNWPRTGDLRRIS